MDEKIKFINVSKLDVAKRELEHAIKLFFNYGDFVMIHLSICACEDILSGMGKATGVTSIKRQLKDNIKPEKQKYVMDKLNAPYNFFKHADKDSTKLLKFAPESSEYTIWDCVNMYQRLTGEITGLMTSFRGWFMLKNKDLFIDDQHSEIIKQLGANLDIKDRIYFLKLASLAESNRSG